MPPVAGVPGLDGEAFSSCDAAAAGASLAGIGEDAVDCFAGDSSFVHVGSRILRSRSGGTCNVTRVDALPFDFRRSLSLEGVVVLVLEGMMFCV